jgi:hypothetical protein
MKWHYLIIILLLFLMACAEPQNVEIQTVEEEANEVQEFATIHESGWKTPWKLGFNDGGWEDSPYLTRDGQQILFFWHPWKDLAVPGRMDELIQYLLKNQESAIIDGIDGKIYVSKYPFDNKEIHWVSQNKTLPSTEAYPYISLAGDIYYTSTLEAWELMDSTPSRFYKNKEMLLIDADEIQISNPHLCEARDELWFDCPGDTNICVIQNYSTGGTYELAPYPINYDDTENVVDFQPYLTDDCNTLYFSSSRNAEVSFFAIYKTIRTETGWSQPEVYLSHPDGVAEFSMTADGNAISFIQLFWREDGTPGTDVWYTEKKEGTH